MQRFAQSPADPAFVQSPYGFYEELRATDHIVYWEDLDLPVATTYEAVSAVLKDRRLGRKMPGRKWAVDDPVLGAFWALEQHSILEHEPPEHTRLRRLIHRAFTSRNVAYLAPQISRIADELIDAFPSGPFDLITAFAEPLPVRVIARLLGMPEDMAPEFLRWSHAMVAMYQPSTSPEIEAAAGAAAREFSDFLRGFVDKRRAEPASDLLTTLIAVEENGDHLSTDELVATAVLLLNAGHEATVHSLGNGVKALVEHGDVRDTLRPEHIEAAVEEILRHDSPLHLFRRWIYEDVELFGHQFSAGDEIGCLLASANRDDAIWPDGDRFVPRRAIRTNMAFGAGIHFCVGAPLARLEMQIALPLLFARHPDLAIVESPRYADIWHFHGLEKLVVKV